MKQERVFILHPFLVAAYSVLALAASNSAEVWLRDLTAPTVIALWIAAVAWLIGRIVTRNRHVGGIVALAIVVWFIWYDYIRQYFSHQPWLQPLSVPRYAVPLILLLLLAIPYIVARRFSGQLPRITRYLNVTAGILVAIPAIGWIRSWDGGIQGQSYSAEQDSIHVAPVSRGADAGSRPDIYVIILDKYTGSRSLKANYGYDNSAFEDSLRSVGFIVPSNPHSNYVHTHLALSAFLNWHLLDDRPPDLRANSGALLVDYAAIENNRTWRFLRGLGYRFIFSPSAYPATARNKYADLQMPVPSQIVGEFATVWSRKTLVLPLARWWCGLFGCKRRAFPYTPAPASVIDGKFDHIGQLPDSAGPLFVFAHFALPHEPYIYSADCTHKEPYWPEADSGKEEALVKAAYIQQIECVNRKVLLLTSQLIEKSKQPPIIVLQADHGHGRLGRDFASLHDAGAERASERTDIFAAYYLPGHPAGVVYDSITPVNVLPRIFNHYFEANIPLQPDATFWSTWDEPFKFTRMR
jgi:hypothetical protein